MPSTARASSGQPSTSTAATRPPQAATMVPRCMLLVSFQTSDLQHAAAVEGQPGHQVEDADDEVGAGQAPHREARAARRA